MASPIVKQILDINMGTLKYAPYNHYHMYTWGPSKYDVRWGREGSAKSDFISKGSLIKRLMRGGGGEKRAKII